LFIYIYDSLLGDGNVDDASLDYSKLGSTNDSNITNGDGNLVTESEVNRL